MAYTNARWINAEQTAVAADLDGTRAAATSGSVAFEEIMKAGPVSAYVPPPVEPEPVSEIDQLNAKVAKLQAFLDVLQQEAAKKLGG